MDFKLTLHAQKRIRERDISESLISQAIYNPTKISTDSEGVILIKKLYFYKNKNRLLIVAGKKLGSLFLVFTVIDTSKVTKYL